MSAVGWSRFQFAFTIIYHYLFPQLSMGLALLIVIFKALYFKKKDIVYNESARFWTRIFGINFAVGVVTGIPMEFQFGTNWAAFSNFAGGVIGMSLALEGMFAFFAESAFLGILLFGEKRFGPKVHMLSAVMLFLGSWLSGYFIIVTNAFMQHPVGYAAGQGGALHLAQPLTYLLNPWALWEYSHNMVATVATASFVVCAVAAYYILSNVHVEHAKVFLKVAVVTGCAASLLQIFPTGDGQGKMMSKYQKPALAAMEGKFTTSSNASLAIMGQPNMATGKIENPIEVPGILSFLAYGDFGAKVQGLNSFPKNQQPDNVELLYYSYHIMVGLGTLFILLMLFSAWQLRGGRLFRNRALLWVLMLSFPFPYIATTAGWMVAEIGRQPWVVYGLERTLTGASPTVSGGDVAFTTLGFCGLYSVVALLFAYMIMRELGRGPESETSSVSLGTSLPASSH